jgi:Threonine dehydrogenase and related Zn-dependent dehydrogenases
MASVQPAVARAFWVTDVDTGELRTEMLPCPTREQVMLRTRYTGISRGTETLVFQARVPASQHQAMRCPFQAGDFPFPVKYGYALVGEVEAGPPALLGRQVFCLWPHQDRIVTGADTVATIPEGLPPGRAVLAANMETALNGIWDAGIAAGDRVCVVGAGVVGLLVAYLAARIPAVTVTVIDIDAGKAEITSALGCGFRAAPGDATDFDVVVHASGNPAGLETALALAGFEATILELSWFGDRRVGLPLGEAFHSRRLTIRSSQVGHLPPPRRPRWTHRRRLETALALLADDRLDRLISGESPFADLPKVMRSLADGSLSSLCHRIRY